MLKNNPSLKGLLLAVIAAIASFGIYFLFLAKPNYYLVDNPTPDTYFFRINNGEQKILASGQYLKINLDKGKNDIKVFDQNKKMLYDSSFQVIKDRGMLNIAHKDYYVFKQYYGYFRDKDSLILSQGHTTIDGKNFIGDIKKSNKLYNEDFYFNIDEDYDKVIKNIDKVESRTKIFRKQDFINYYNENYKF
ncbi:hypothetical protein [Soonwooa purpurea]